MPLPDALRTEAEKRARGSHQRRTAPLWIFFPMPEAFFTEPTTGYWRDITADIPPRLRPRHPTAMGYPVRLPDGRVLVLPLRQLPSGDRAVASLIANQALMCRHRRAHRRHG